MRNRREGEQVPVNINDIVVLAAFSDKTKPHLTPKKVKIHKDDDWLYMTVNQIEFVEHLTPGSLYRIVYHCVSDNPELINTYVKYPYI